MKKGLRLEQTLHVVTRRRVNRSPDEEGITTEMKRGSNANSSRESQP